VKRVDIAAILKDPVARRRMCVDTIIAMQAREGIETTRAQAEAAYDRVQAEKMATSRIAAATGATFSRRSRR
jgi:hypothetical protein